MSSEELNATGLITNTPSGSWFENLKRTWQSVSSKIASFSEVVGQVLVTFGDAVYQHLQAHDKFYLILMQLGWPPLTNKSAYESEFLKIVQDYEKNGLDAVKDRIESMMFKRHDDEYLKKLLQEWAKSPLLKSRIHILRPALNAHIRGEYILAIPVMLPQIEGIIASGFRFSGWMKAEKFKKHIESLLHEAIVIKSKNEAIREFVTVKLMVPFLHGQTVESPLSRHAILHGADLNYGTKANSLKLILFLENLRQLFRFEALEDGTLFHVYGCLSLRASVKKRLFFSNAQEAIRMGLRGCKRCRARQYY